MSDIKDVLRERGSVHGEFADNAYLAQKLKDAVRSSARWGSMTAVQREAVDNTLQKIARLCSGDPNYVDHWVDIIGYNTLAKDRLPGPKDVQIRTTGETCSVCGMLLSTPESKARLLCPQHFTVEFKKSLRDDPKLSHQECSKCKTPLIVTSSKNVGLCTSCRINSPQ